MPPPRPGKGTHIDFPPALHDALRLAAFHARLPIAEVVRRACAEYVQKVNATTITEDDASIRRRMYIEGMRMDAALRQEAFDRALGIAKREGTQP